MTKHFTLALLGLALAWPVAAAMPEADGSLRAVLDDLTALRDARGLRFDDPADAARFARAIRKLEDLSARAGREEDCFPLENHRPRAIELIKQRYHPSEWDAMITPLPRYLGTGEIDFLQALIRRVHASEAPDRLRAYFNHPPPYRDHNKKGEFAVFLLERLPPNTVRACIELLPEYIYASEIEPAKRLVTSTAPGALPLELRRFFGSE